MGPQRPQPLGCASSSADPESPIPRPTSGARPLRPIVIALCLSGLAPAAAPAATAELSGSVLRVTAAAGEANRIQVTWGPSTIAIGDGLASVEPGLGCTRDAITATVSCTASGISSVEIDAGDGDDTVELVGVTRPARIADGAGDDVVAGGAGADTFVAGTGADVLTGNGGVDVVDYSSRTTPLSVRLDDVAGDGAAGEGDDVRSDIETVVGGTAADTLVGASGAQTLRGGGGADLLDGGAGADRLEGGSGTDTADYSSRSAAVTVTLDGTANDGAAGELDNATGDVENVAGGAGNDALTGSTAANELAGGDGNDTIGGGAGDDALLGGAGTDTLDGAAGRDRLDGGAGNDVIGGGTDSDVADYGSRTTSVSGDLNGTTGFGESGESDTVGADIEGLQGGAGDDRLTGDASANVLRGGAGDDVLDGRTGGDDVSGGDGTDSVSYAARSDSVTIRLDNSANDGQANEGDNVRSDVEQLTGSPDDDRIYADDDANVIAGNGGSDSVYGYGGDDTITVGNGADAVWGGSGADTITGAEGANKLYGEDGNDTVGSGGAADTVDGGAGDDRVAGGGGNDTVNGGDGNDVLEGGDGNDRFSGGAGNDTLEGAGGDDSGDGGAGDDRIAAGEGNDNLAGGDGIDWLDGAGGNDRLGGANGNDNLDGGAGDDTVNGDAGDDQLRAGDGHDSANGGDGIDALDGADGNDTLNGNRGADAVDGGPGNDRVGGNEDDDAVNGGAGDDQVWGGSGNDVVGDADGNDKLYGDDGLDHLSAGPGNDALAGGNHDDLVDGGAGDDTVNGDAGNDRLQGADGTDRLLGGTGDDIHDGGAGADQIDGADGQDTVDYGGRTVGVLVTNDGKADDGQAGEGDNVASSIDDAIGSAAGDRITFATDWPHKLDGGDGDDLLRGGGREDTLVGGRGKDMLFGEGGRDAYDGGAGPDHLSASDDHDETLLCGPGKDRGVINKGDVVNACEKTTVKRSVGGGDVPSSPPRPQQPTPARPSLPAPSGLIGVRRVASRGTFVPIPGAPQHRIDRRILKDVAWILKRYRVAITAGQERAGHAIGGEHPIGLALDIVPAAGGSWDDVDRLARWAEPRQNYPRPPFRWVGYNGDVNHGRGHHLHLSWMHASTRPGKPAAWVVAMRFRSGAGGGRGKRRPAARPRGGRMIKYARTNGALGRTLKLDSGLDAIRPCSGVGPLTPTLKAASRAFGLDGWRILAALTETESAFGCNMGPSSAGALGWTQFMPGTWDMYGMDADGDGRASPFNSVDAVFASARYLRASGAPRDWRRALFAYNHSTAYVNTVLARSKKY